jgi:hypothetical protein
MEHEGDKVMDDQWKDKTNDEKRHYMDVTQALYSTSPKAIKSLPPKRRKVTRSSTDLGNPSESLIQCNLVKWARLQRIPLISIPNHGKRSAWSGQKEVAMGLTKGVSDLFLARPVGKFGGMWIELKSKGRTPSVEQCEWLARMATEGYQTGWYDNFDDAMKAIIKYLAS